jgi:hypothetical protein
MPALLCLWLKQPRAQQTALDKASRDVVLSGLDGLAKQHQQFVYEAQI